MSESVNVFERVVGVCDWRITSLLALLTSTAFGFNGLWRFAGPFSKVCDTEFALKIQQRKTLIIISYFTGVLELEHLMDKDDMILYYL